MTEDNNQRVLEEWSERLTQALQILDLTVDNDLIRQVAQKSSDSMVPDAGPLATFFVGYAAGLSKTSDVKSGNDAVKTAAETVLTLAETGTSDEAPAADGWTGTAQ
ncbi:DUF6457 domain-containing protein [Marisediminicola senii]|uniref:DUF6457 domain-containing protein n=1 Tax=Marisediminicola senii TaxID=2711233 RepID=UPI0013EC3EB7|nr:DUF6457 domain-containing protein [Marisediminicola senii]